MTFKWHVLRTLYITTFLNAQSKSNINIFKTSCPINLPRTDGQEILPSLSSKSPDSLKRSLRVAPKCSINTRGIGPFTSNLSPSNSVSG